MTAPLQPPHRPQRPTSRNRARSRSIWLWQLALAAGVITIALSGSILMPQMFSYPPFLIGALGIMAITIATLAAPWRRIPSPFIASVPLADIVAIGLISFGGMLRLSYLWVFPIAWVATYFSLRWLVTALSAVAVLLTIDVIAHGAAPMTTQRLIVIVLCLTFLGLAIHGVAQHARALRRLLRRHGERLQATLDRTQEQARRTTQMFDSLDVAVARISSTGDILAANDAYIELYALDPADLSLPGASVEYDRERGDALPAADRPRARAARGELTDGERVWLYDPHGRWHALAVATRPLPTASDGASTVLIVEDVTDLHRAEHERRALIASVSHELRNPLTAVLGHTELLLEHGDLSPHTRAQIAVIDAAGERMLRLVAENLSNADAPAPPPTAMNPVDVGRVLAASVESFRPAANAGGVTLTLEVEPELIAHADAFRLRQVIDNLLTNAVKYTPADGAVTITATEDGTALSITVADTGIGIEPDELPHIFEPYFRGQSARDSGTTGSGIGMGIVREILDDHGGTVSVDSAPGVGTVARVRVPRLRVDRDQEEDRCSDRA